MATSTVAIITGASQGIGRATAVRLSQDFSSLVLVARNREGLLETANLVAKAGAAKTLLLSLDLSDPGSADTVGTRTLAEFGRIDALVNIAGAVPQTDLFDMDDAAWDSGFNLKFHGARRLTIRSWDSLKATGGSVILISGNSAEAPKAPFAAVACVNAAIIALAKAFWDRGIQDGVQVNSVLPGPVMTGRRRTYLEKWAPNHNITVEEAMKAFPTEAGITRFGEPEEISELMAFILSPAAKWMTGSALRMDGGEIKST
ncbi:3-oxoacyl-(acyl-carrier protein) reductase [Trichoderma gamsii]|uniref:3-oxoacyl-(Acyl-carrier protein) reductase n=1 Tax=Trichoderma gamsii TaxID=398673 RepID=A0A2P4Z712_9HYPO|nr:3-oxoacyl-(acyl-carrier protein) reductase [Trichoderma gamsii]PON20077.1 3-oxoacyl-(acyl-carrier protein) reductase [Trichoderma gamsii]